MSSTSGSADTAGERSLLQRRLGLFGGVLFGIHALGIGFEVVAVQQPSTAAVPIGLMSAAALVNLGVFLVGRGPARSTRFLRVVEASSVLSASLAVGWIPHAIPAAFLDALLHPDPHAEGPALYMGALGPHAAYVYAALACLLAATQAHALRAALVPSRVRRTLALTAGGGLLMVAAMILPIPGWAPDRALRAALPDFTFQVVILDAAIWWTLTTIVCVVLTWVIHGLRREIRSARRLGQYHIETKIGEGGMGIVYRAHHALLRRPTAIKLLPPDKVGETSLARFEREVRLTATLTHPNTVRIYDYGRTPGGVFYYAMELLDGAALNEIVALDGPQPPGRAVHVMRAVAGALREAHGKGLVHRDIKPGNIVLCDHAGDVDVPMLLDFGLVKQVGEAADVALTQEHTITGTPAYLAPEVIRASDAASPASDLYALGGVAYFLLTGTHVFDGTNVVEVCSHHLHTPPEPPSARLGAPVPESLERLVLRLLAKDPAARPGSAEDLLERIDALEGVDEWTPALRTAWWATHGPTLREGHTVVDPSGDTIAIDVAARS
ncbi:MAG: serine/threonine-protein kinase [Sandaracinaceae bacterium]